MNDQTAGQGRNDERDSAPGQPAERSQGLVEKEGPNKQHGDALQHGSGNRHGVHEAAQQPDR